MDWIHCNNCASQPGDDEGKKFVTTNCGHIYCESCLLLPELKKCRVCQSSYQTMPLSSKMSKDVEIYFRNPIPEIQKFLRVLEFQQSHRTRLTNINRDKIKTYYNLGKEMKILKEESKRLEKENAFMKEENKRLNDVVIEYKRKIECLRGHQKRSTQIQPSAQNDFPIFRNKTPKLMKPSSDVISPDNHCNVLKQPPESSDFFVMSSTKGKRRDANMFKPPLPKMPESYRSIQTLASDLSSPASIKPSIRDILLQKYQQYKRVKLPGDKGGPSPSLSAFCRLSLSKLSSAPKQDSQTISKYSHYFNKR